MDFFFFFKKKKSFSESNGGLEFHIVHEKGRAAGSRRGQLGKLVSKGQRGSDQ